MNGYKSLLLGLVILVMSTSLSAQSGWNWPENKSKAEEKNVLYVDYMKSGDFKKSAQHLHWLLANAPDLNPSIYINGANIFEELANAEKNDAQKLIYEDSALMMYDDRIKYFGQEAYVLNRKAFAAYKLKRTRKESYPMLLELFEKAFELNGENTMANNTIAYMAALKAYQSTGGDVTDEDVLKVYDVINDVIEANIANGNKVSIYQRYKESLDDMLASMVTIDCIFVEDNMMDRFRANPDDMKYAKKVFQLLLTGKCTDTDIFIEVAQPIYKEEPSAVLAKILASRAKTNGEPEKAIAYYKDAIEMMESNDKKADLHMDIADVHARSGSKNAARSAALTAVGLDPTKKEAYNFIGQLYMNSFESCRKGVSPVADRAIFIAAYDMFAKGGNSSKMQAAAEQFPSKSELFDYDYVEGDSFKVECWINETVTLKTR
ncbi:MAG: hypothetical protein LAT68_04105 [Cyclobacteriaceae bacterium]|nr:hypothetical protein [Cyclobacteriaceae bacterium]MCH8515492.1 hypothetical protein [Cyclobacteriaceae bacterium]